MNSPAAVPKGLPETDVRKTMPNVRALLLKIASTVDGEE
jgi:hypothetical protein